jgi:hypothetical protein
MKSSENPTFSNDKFVPASTLVIVFGLKKQSLQEDFKDNC